ncbi:hypothetical protein WK68_24680 [Burkholderia ubonensis]|nr:hypothetical protein WK68_24680 [Burkholderia ubonensis]
MHILPFFSIAEAKENAVALQKAFQFYCLRYASAANDSEAHALGLQRTHKLIAKALGCINWNDLVGTLALKTRRPIYFDSNGSARAQHTELAARLLPFLSHEDKGRRVYAALSYSAFGCCPSARKSAYGMMKLMPCKTLDQWHQLQMLEAGYSHVTRYRSNRTAYECDLLRWEYDKKVAQILGTPVPRKPYKPRSVQVR